MEFVIKSKDGFTSVFLNGVDISDVITDIEFKHNAEEPLPKVKLSFYPIDMAKIKGD